MCEILLKKLEEPNRHLWTWRICKIKLGSVGGGKMKMDLVVDIFSSGSHWWTESYRCQGNGGNHHRGKWRDKSMGARGPSAYQKMEKMRTQTRRKWAPMVWKGNREKEAPESSEECYGRGQAALSKLLMTKQGGPRQKHWVYKHGRQRCYYLGEICKPRYLQINCNFEDCNIHGASLWFFESSTKDESCLLHGRLPIPSSLPRPGSPKPGSRPGTTHSRSGLSSVPEWPGKDEDQANLESLGELSHLNEINMLHREQQKNI